MDKDRELLPDVQFGDETADDELSELGDDGHDDDEVTESPPEVVAILGFDPLDIDEDDDRA